MTTDPRPRPRPRRRHAAAGARWVTAGLAVSGTVGMTGYLAIDGARDVVSSATVEPGGVLGATATTVPNVLPALPIPPVTPPVTVRPRPTSSATRRSSAATPRPAATIVAPTTAPARTQAPVVVQPAPRRTHAVTRGSAG